MPHATFEPAFVKESEGGTNMFIVYLHKQVFLFRPNLVLSERSCRPNGEVLRSTPKGVLTAQDLGGLPV